MIYTSTRDASVRVSAAEAIAKGISEDGGLFVPMTIPTLNLVDIEKLARLDYIGRAKEVLKLYLTDFTEDELAMCVEGAYKAEKFSSPKIAPLYKLNDNAQILEILVFYPVDGVSPMQKLQMTTQEGKNVSVCAIEGNFDDAQSGVKAIFTNQEIKEKFKENHLAFSSAHSINWSCLVPQIVYYVSAYCDLVKAGEVKLGDPMNVVVPTGNFGNILAAYYAQQMGVPIKKLVCASNANNVLTTGVYNKNRPFYCTASPSMDILISSNLERLLFALSGQDAEATAKLMHQLSETGEYKIPEKMQKTISEMFAAGYCDDEDTKRTIRKIFEEYNYLCDTHTAVAVNVYASYRTKTGDNTKTVIASTANPYKFSNSVLSAIENHIQSKDEFETVEELHEKTGAPVPPQLATLKGKTPRFTKVSAKEDMAAVVFEMLGI